MKQGTKRMRYGLLLLLTLLCINGTLTASAADDRLGTVVDGSLLTEDTSAEIESVLGSSLARGTYLACGQGSIRITATRTLNLAGATICKQTVDTVKVKIYLQKLVGNSWNTLYTSPTAVATNDYFVSTGKTYTVTGGAYYRLCSTHIVIHNGTMESVTSNSDGIWVD